VETIKPKIKKEILNNTYGKFVVEPLERGYGVTLGNSLRRVLLSSIPGDSITWVKIDGVLHEFSTISGVMEDVTQIILNLKGMTFRLKTPEPQTLYLNVKGKREVKAGDFQHSSEVEILDKDWHIATLTEKNAELSMEVGVAKGKGYIPIEKQPPQEEIGIIPVDYVFSPVKKVNFRVENSRVGQVTDYDRLILEVWTDGSVSPDEAVSESARILNEYLTLFRAIISPEQPEISISTPGMLQSQKRLLDKPIEEMNFSTRTLNCLKKTKINTLGELLQRSAEELKEFGETSLSEVRQKLSELGLKLKGD
jgi:DNA-directed RNA polymerase subunit alpha